jgi:hypothetical protein
VIDEIPPFVHRTGNPSSEFEDRLIHVMVTKPIIHISSDGPLAVDAQVRITFGRPWFAYPRPDDFDLVGVDGFWSRSRPMPALDPAPPVGALAPLRSGYPWIAPNHPHRLGNHIGGLGLHWQSLVITPAPPQPLAPVPADPKFKWWTRLRDVPSSYITSNNETERFLYYDGPSQYPAPLSVSRAGDQLRFQAPPNRDRTPPYVRDGQQNESSSTQRTGLFIRVHNHTATACIVPPPTIPSQITDAPENASRSATIPLLPLSPDAPAQLLKLLLASGLTPEESAGLIDAWTPQFFQTDGDRFLLLMSSADYDAFCPLSITPPPTTLVRTGIILTEFGNL